MPGRGAFSNRANALIILTWWVEANTSYSARVSNLDCLCRGICLRATSWPVPLSLARRTIPNLPLPSSSSSKYLPTNCLDSHSAPLSTSNLDKVTTIDGEVVLPSSPITRKLYEASGDTSSTTGGSFICFDTGTHRCNGKVRHSMLHDALPISSLSQSTSTFEDPNARAKVLLFPPKRKHKTV